MYAWDVAAGCGSGTARNSFPDRISWKILWKNSFSSRRQLPVRQALNAPQPTLHEYINCKKLPQISLQGISPHEISLHAHYTVTAVKIKHTICVFCVIFTVTVTMPLQPGFQEGLCCNTVTLPCSAGLLKTVSYFSVPLLSLWMTSWAPPSTILVAETRVSLALSWNSGMVSAPQLHMVDLTLRMVLATFSFRGPA